MPQPPADPTLDPGSEDAELLARLDAALAPPPAPEGLNAAVLDATRDFLPAAAVAGRIGGGARWGGLRVWAAAAALGLVAAVGWQAWSPTVPQGVVSGPVAGEPGVETQTPAGPPQVAAAVETLAADWLDDAAPAASSLSRVADRLAEAAGAGPWSQVGLEGLDDAIAWETEMDGAAGGAWLF